MLSISSDNQNFFKYWIRSNGSLSTEMTPVRIFEESFKMTISFECNIINERFWMAGAWKQPGTSYIPPTIMLLMGMWISLTKNPTNPIIRNPNPVALAILANSFNCAVILNWKRKKLMLMCTAILDWCMLEMSGLKYLYGQVLCIS